MQYRHVHTLHIRCHINTYNTDDRRANVLQLQHELLSAVHRTVTLYAARLNPKLSASELEDMIADYMLKLQGEAFKQIVSTVPATAEYLWTSGKKHGVVHGMEFCSVLNAIIRADLPNELEVMDVACIHQCAYNARFKNQNHLFV